MSSYAVLIWSIGLALFVVPCVLPRRLLPLFIAVAAVAFGFVLHDHHVHELDGGVAATLGLLIVIWWAAHGIAGLVARLAIMGLRRRGVRWRYAWLPAPIMFAPMTAAPWLLPG